MFSTPKSKRSLSFVQKHSRSVWQWFMEHPNSDERNLGVKKNHQRSFFDEFLDEIWLRKTGFWKMFKSLELRVLLHRVYIDKRSCTNACMYPHVHNQDRYQNVTRCTTRMLLCKHAIGKTSKMIKSFLFFFFWFSHQSHLVKSLQL